jgi:hypothetical protein
MSLPPSVTPEQIAALPPEFQVLLTAVNAPSFPRDKSLEQDSQESCILGLAFPNHKSFPNKSMELTHHDLVALHVLVEFAIPKLHFRLGGVSVLALGMSVPEATVNEDHGAIARQNNVGFPRKVATVEAESIAEPV